MVREILPLLILVTGCSGGGSATAPAHQLTSLQVRGALLDWFECIECSSGELERVLALKEAAHEGLVLTLDEGLTLTREEKLRDHLRAAYDKMNAYAERTGQNEPSLSRDDFVNRELERYRMLYRSRAARALHAFNLPVTRTHLLRARAKLETSNLLADVKLRDLIDSLND